MNPAKLNRTITILTKSERKDSEGLMVIEWSPLVTLRAAVEPLQGREYFLAAAVSQESTVRFRIRYRKGITADMRIQYGERIFEIKSPPIDPKEAHRELHLMGVEVSGNG